MRDETLGRSLCSGLPGRSRGCRLLGTLVGLIALTASATHGEDASGPVLTLLGNVVASRATLLAIDDASLPLRKNLGLYLSKPKVRAEAVLKPSPLGSGAPDDLAAHFYGTVLHDDGRYRMWYYASYWRNNPDWPPQMSRQIPETGYGPLYQGPLCYAESDDGISWRKPSLGQVLFKGSRDNNALDLPHAIVSGAVVIKDDADPDPARRYKMTYQFFPNYTPTAMAEYGNMPTVALAVSPDGIKWKVIGIPFRSQFVEPSSFIKHAGQYIIHYQTGAELGGYFGEGGSKTGRTGMARVTRDFGHWPDVLAEAFALTEPQDPAKRGMSGSYDQVHLGVGAASFGNVCVGLYGLWHNADNQKSFNAISCDFGLLVSNDGIRFREPVKGHRFLRREESPVTPVPDHPFNTVLCQANGILNVADETRIYHGRWRNADGEAATLKYHYGEVALATLPRDRWGALGLHPKMTEGTVWTAPFVLQRRGCKVSINADGVKGMSVCVADEAFRLLPEFSGDRAGVLAGSDGLDCAIRWPAGSLDALAGKALRLQIQVTKADGSQPRLYAIYISGD